VNNYLLGPPAPTMALVAVGTRRADDDVDRFGAVHINLINLLRRWQKTTHSDLIK
jgi:hypothetical protein